MIIGDGSVAKMLNDREGAVFFASGVSNSQNVDISGIEREFDTLWQLHARIDYTKYCLFYFSTISVDYIVSDYTSHKIEMEKLVRTFWPNYNIIRIGNIWECQNPNTFINYIKAKQAKGEPVEIRDEWKYMISKEQLLLLTDNLPLTGRNTISVFGEMKKVKDCL